MSNNDRAFFCFALATCFSMLLGGYEKALATDARRPNILLVYLDDLGWKDTGFMGSDF